MENLDKKQKSVVFFDMDGTLVDGQTQLLLIRCLRKKRLLSNASFILIAAWFVFYKIGLVRNPQTPLLYALKKLSVVPLVELERTIDDLIKSGELRLIEPGVEALEHHKQSGATIVLISNALSIIVKKVAKRLEIKNIISTVPTIHSGMLTGGIDGAIMYGQEKLSAAKRFCESLGVNIADTTFYTDHDSDLALFKSVGTAIAIRPNAKLRRIALSGNFKIID